MSTAQVLGVLGFGYRPIAPTPMSPLSTHKTPIIKRPGNFLTPHQHHVRYSERKATQNPRGIANDVLEELVALQARIFTDISKALSSFREIFSKG